MKGKPASRQGILRLKFMARRYNWRFAHQEDADPAVGRSIGVIGEEGIAARLAGNLENAVGVDPLGGQNSTGGIGTGGRKLPIRDAPGADKLCRVRMAGNGNAVRKAVHDA